MKKCPSCFGNLYDDSPQECKYCGKKFGLSRIRIMFITMLLGTIVLAILASILPSL